MKYFLIIFVAPFIAAQGQTAFSSTSVRAQLSPVPPYPAEGVIPRALKDQYIFRDLQTGELIFSYPSEMATPSAATAVDRGGRLEQRAFPRNGTDPWFDVVVSANNGEFSYSYVVRNGPRASQAIAEWHIETSAQAAARKGWDSSVGRNPIAPGSSSDKIMISSPLRPGFVMTSVSGLAPTAIDRSQLPPPVQAQLDKLKNFNIDNQTVLTIGPKFPAATPDIAVVMDFVVSIEMLLRHQHLASDSPFIQELGGKLKTYLDQASAAKDDSGSLPSFELNVMTKPTTAFERQILAALVTSLQNK